MLRKISVKAIAVVLVVLGIFLIIDSFLAFFVALADKHINLGFSIYIPFLFYAGFYLYKLQESGRKLTLVLLAIQAVANLGLLAWVLFQKGASSQFWFSFLGNKYVFAENQVTFAVVILTWSFALFLMIIFLIQKQTREMFSSKENAISSQSNVMQ